MAKKRAAPAWRRGFLRALARTGNVRAAAEAAGVDKSTVYPARKGDAGFAARWDAALAKGQAGAAGSPRRGAPRDDGKGRELVVRTSKGRAQLVKAAPGRWSAQVERAFLATLRQTGCVEQAARACGLSDTALYYRREKYPDFAARWAAAEAAALQSIDGFLTHSTIATFNPAVAGDANLPKVTIDQAIQISRMKGNRADRNAAGAGRGGTRAFDPARRAAEEKDLTQAILKLLAMLDRRRGRERRAAGWQQDEAGRWIPPGWVREGDGDADGADPS